MTGVQTCALPISGKYAKTIGLNEDVFKLERIQQSIDLLMNGSIEYEFRTTVMKELHTSEDLEQISTWIRGCQHYYLQQYLDSGNVINPIYSAYDAKTMHELQQVVSKNIPHVELRGVKEG